MRLALSEMFIVMLRLQTLKWPGMCLVTWSHCQATEGDVISCFSWASCRPQSMRAGNEKIKYKIRVTVKVLMFHFKDYI
jgi:hypothetical protein